MVSLQDKELELIRKAVDLAEQKEGRRIIESPEMKQIINIVENFLRSTKTVCYGGTAINNILPVSDQFYDKSIEIPDYDFFSTTPQKHAIELADRYYKEGFTEVEAKSGSHTGTYKVFVNFIPVADITLLSEEFFKNIYKDAIIRDGIRYCPPNFLRMAMYLELSRPAGDISRWEKVVKRLMLLNKNYPLRGVNCENVDYQRDMETDVLEEESIYKYVRNSFINQGVVFFGGFAIGHYSKYMPAKYRRQLERVPDFDVLAIDAKECATIVKEKLQYMGIKHVKIIKHKAPSEWLSEHYEIIVNKETVAFVYQTKACYSYNVITVDGKKIHIATIDTMLSLYLAFLYADNDCYGGCDRILCMADFLFNVQQKNRLEQKGLLKRFTVQCYGHQESLQEMRAEKAIKFKELKGDRGSKEYNLYFFKYIPGETKPKKTKKNTKKTKKATNKTPSKRKTEKNTKTRKGFFKNIERLL